jgi:hypothetical protein
VISSSKRGERDDVLVRPDRAVVAVVDMADVELTQCLLPCCEEATGVAVFLEVEVVALAVAVGCEVLGIETDVPCIVDVNLEPTVACVVVEVELAHEISP